MSPESVCLIARLCVHVYVYHIAQLHVCVCMSVCICAGTLRTHAFACVFVRECVESEGHVQLPRSPSRFLGLESLSIKHTLSPANYHSLSLRFSSRSLSR